VDNIQQLISPVKPTAKARPKISGTAALEKAFDVLDMIAQAPSPPTFAELAAATGLPRSTLYRILALLEARRLVGMDASGTRYQLGLHLMEISRWAWERSDVRSAASAVLRTLAKETGETVHLASLVDNEIVYLDKVDSEHSIRLYSAIGGRCPVHCTGLGKAMTAFLSPQARASLLDQLNFHRFTPHTLANGDQMMREWDDIRRTHIAFDREEHAEGVHCLAAPIFDFRGQPVAALSVTAPTFRVSVAQLERLAPSVLAAARTITDALGGAIPAGRAA